MIKKGKCVGILYYRIVGGTYEFGVHNGVLLDDVHSNNVVRVHHVADPDMKIETLYFYKTFAEYQQSTKHRKYVRIKVEEIPGSSSKPGIAFLSASKPNNPHDGKFVKFVRSNGATITDFNAVTKLSKTELYNGTLHYRHWTLKALTSGKYDMQLNMDAKEHFILKIKKL
jgi:hypothetical protein